MHMKVALLMYMEVTYMYNIANQCHASCLYGPTHNCKLSSVIHALYSCSEILIHGGMHRVQHYNMA